MQHAKKTTVGRNIGYQTDEEQNPNFVAVTDACVRHAVIQFPFRSTLSYCPLEIMKTANQNKSKNYDGQNTSLLARKACLQF